MNSLRWFCTSLLIICSVAWSSDSPAGPTPDITLKAAFAADFLVGAAVNSKQIMGQDEDSLALVARQFNALTPENVMKWEVIQPQENQFDFEPSDALVTFSNVNDMHLTGHALIWHQQTPAWVFEDEAGNPATRELLLKRMETHINTVVGRYRGRVQSWDVVNEALNDDGSLRSTPWSTIIGPDFLEKAFEFAHKADPGAELYYNDYNLFQPDKRAGAVRLVRGLLDKGLRVDGIGMQGHYGLDNPQDMSEFEDSISAFSALGVSVLITELDISVLPFPEQENWGADISMDMELEARYNPYPDGMPPAIESAQTEQYLKLFRILLNHRDVVRRVTFWGVNDGHSWKNGWPMQGRTDYPLLFDRNNKPKPVFYRIIGLTTDP